MEQKKHKTSGKRNRNAGHGWELELVKEFLPLYPGVATSRAVNRFRDAQKVDLAYPDEHTMGRFPYNVQAKSYSKPILYPKLLSEIMQSDDAINVIAHKQTQRSGERFMTRGKFAVLNFSDFMKLVAFRRGFEELQKYIDFIPDSERQELDKFLQSIKL